MFTLKIRTGGAAFRDESAESNRRNELPLDPYSCELRRLLDEVKKQLVCGHTDGKLMDINGNKVGEWELTD